MMLTMRTTLNLEDDALLVAKRFAERQKLSLGEAVSQLVRRGAQPPAESAASRSPLRGRFALLPTRDELITPQHVRTLMEQEGI